ncbi:MAG: ABC transporter substrate-binding protein [Dongiaceae bacterium]
MRFKILGTSSLVLAGLTALALAAEKPALAADSLTIVSWGGAYQTSQREAFFKPFAKETGVQITEEEYTGELAKVRAQVETGTISWNVVDLTTRSALAACAEGLIEPIDWAKLGLDPANFIGGDLQECGVPNIVYSTVLAYDADRLKEGPTKIEDIFDLEKFPGKRSLQKDPFGNLEWALIADGVPAADIYKVLATEEGIDRAFKKLDTIKSQVVWWEAGAQPPQLLADGEVVMASGWNGRFYDAVKNEGKNFVIVWDRQVLDWDWWAIPKGSDKVDLAYQFIAFASRADTMADQTNYITYGPANMDSESKISSEIMAQLPTSAENMTTAIAPDIQFWADNADQLTQRFTAWLAQ